MPAVATPGNVIVDTFQVTDDGQDGTGQSYEQGYVHLVVTAPAAWTSIAATFGQVLWQLSDPVGITWDSTSGSLGPQPHLRDVESEHRLISSTFTSPPCATRPQQRLDHAHDAAAGVDTERQQRLCDAVHGSGLELDAP